MTKKGEPNTWIVKKMTNVGGSEPFASQLLEVHDIVGATLRVVKNDEIFFRSCLHAPEGEPFVCYFRDRGFRRGEALLTIL